MTPVGDHRRSAASGGADERARAQTQSAAGERAPAQTQSAADGSPSARQQTGRARRRLLAAIVGVLTLAAVLLALGAKGGEAESGRTYEIEFDNAFGLADGGDFKIAGVQAGETTDFRVVGQARPRAVVTARITRDGFPALREDARCEIRPQSLIGEYYVDCQPGTSAAKLPDGGRVPVERTSSTIPVDLVGNIMRRPYRERLRLIVEELGAGLAGRPEDLAEVLRRAHPGLRETSETLELLGRETGTLKQLIVDTDTTIGALERRKRDVTRFVGEAGETAEIAASRREELARSFERLPGFLAQLAPYMARLGELTEAQTPVLRNLQAASGDLDTFLTRLRPFADTGAPALKALGDASEVGLRGVRASREEIAELRALARDVPGFAKPLRQLLQTSDDRARAVEDDPRAAQTGPPAGDKTHIPAGKSGGFTGYEAIWNYFFWQALTTNNMDATGKVLRLAAVVNECSPYTVKPSQQLLARCNQFLGPTQPGVTTPDPTRTEADAAKSGGTRDRRRTAARQRENRLRDTLGDLLGDAPPGDGAPAPQQPAPSAPLPNVPAVPNVPVPQVPVPTTPAPVPAPPGGGSQGGLPLLDWLLGGG